MEARKLEKLEIQLAKSRTARIFNLRCLANKVTPKTLQIKWKGNKFEQTLIRKAECSLESSVQISRSTTSKLK